MIHAFLLSNDKVDAKIFASNQNEFNSDLELIKTIPREDRLYSEPTKSWIVSNASRHADKYEFIKAAIVTAENQPGLFEEL